LGWQTNRNQHGSRHWPVRLNFIVISFLEQNTHIIVPGAWFFFKISVLVIYFFGRWNLGETAERSTLLSR
jgi:hypothetical protein